MNTKNTNVATVTGNIMKSMTMKIAAAAVAVSAVAAMVPDPSLAADRRVDIRNYTGTTMTAFYSSHISERWNRSDMFGDGVLRPGSSVLLDIDDGTGRCLYDLKAVFANGAVRTKYRVDVCSEDNWTIAR